MYENGSQWTGSLTPVSPHCSTDLLVRFNCTKHNYLLVLGPLNILWHKFVKVAYCIHAKAYLKRVETEVAEVRRTVCPLLAPAG